MHPYRLYLAREFDVPRFGDDVGDVRKEFGGKRADAEEEVVLESREGWMVGGNSILKAGDELAVDVWVAFVV